MKDHVEEVEWWGVKFRDSDWLVGQAANLKRVPRDLLATSSSQRPRFTTLSSSSFHKTPSVVSISMLLSNFLML